MVPDREKNDQSKLETHNFITRKEKYQHKIYITYENSIILLYGAVQTGTYSDINP